MNIVLKKVETPCEFLRPNQRSHTKYENIMRLKKEIPYILFLNIYYIILLIYKKL